MNKNKELNYHWWGINTTDLNNTETSAYEIAKEFGIKNSLDEIDERAKNIAEIWLKNTDKIFENLTETIINAKATALFEYLINTEKLNINDFELDTSSGKILLIHK